MLSTALQPINAPRSGTGVDLWEQCSCYDCLSTSYEENLLDYQRGRPCPRPQRGVGGVGEDPLVLRVTAAQPSGLGGW
jgi:hypothetical protein